MNKKFWVLFFIVFFCFSCSGCALLDLIEKVFSSHYPTQRNVSILVLPPLPLPRNDDEISMQDVKESVTFSDSIRNALLRGVANFNQGSSNTTIYPKYINDRKVVGEFYTNFVNANSKGNVKNFHRGFISQMRDSNRDNSYSCVIYGFFPYSSSMECYNITLVYFDYSSDSMATEKGVVTATPGRTQDSELESMMESLLQKVYD